VKNIGGILGKPKRFTKERSEGFPWEERGAGFFWAGRTR